MNNIEILLRVFKYTLAIIFAIRVIRLLAVKGQCIKDWKKPLDDVICMIEKEENEQKKFVLNNEYQKYVQQEQISKTEINSEISINLLIIILMLI